MSNFSDFIQLMHECVQHYPIWKRPAKSWISHSSRCSSALFFIRTCRAYVCGQFSAFHIERSQKLTNIQRDKVRTNKAHCRPSKNEGLQWVFMFILPALVFAHIYVRGSLASLQMDRSLKYEPNLAWSDDRILAFKCCQNVGVGNSKHPKRGNLCRQIT